MVLIHTRQTDDTTLNVIQWLVYFKKGIFRVNSVDNFKVVEELIAANKVSSVYFNGSGILYNRLSLDDKEASKQMQDYLRTDIEFLYAYLFNKLSGLRSFGLSPYPRNKINKLIVLEEAAKVGFMTPRFQIVATKQELLQLMILWKRIICKSVMDGLNIHTDNIIVNNQPTAEIIAEDIDKFKEYFFPTLIQELIEKQYEVRCFYFREQFYSIAIFSQANSKSEIDGRLVDVENPQRRIPFLLPKELEEKIIKLMQNLDLNYGSVDFIVTQDNQFYFLEINPYGQYGFLSSAGNYYIEKEIAAYL